MQSIIQRLIANGFADFAGLSISGKVPFQQDLINEALAELVQGWSAPQGGTPSSGINPSQLLPLVKKAQVRADEGVLTLEFEIRV